MRNIIILTTVLVLFSLPNIFSQCNSTPDDLGFVTVSGGSNGKITVKANMALTYDVGLFGTLMLEVPVSTTGASIAGASAVGLTFLQFFTSQDIGQPIGKKYAFFTSAQTINPMTLFPNGVDVEIGTISTVPAANISTSSIVMTDLLAPVNNGGTYLYYKTALQVCNMNNFNDNLIADAANIALPIVLSEFTAVRHQNVSGKLDWSTSSETNGSHFEIERSTDAQSWIEIGTVEAKGESSSLTNYEYIDENVNQLRSFSSKYYYRINMFDNDGNSEYSETRMIAFTDLERKINIYPNPTTNRISIDMASESSNATQEAIAILKDNSGKLLKSATILATGISNIDLGDLQSGIYFLEIHTGNKVTYHKIQMID